MRKIIIALVTLVATGIVQAYGQANQATIGINSGNFTVFGDSSLTVPLLEGVAGVPGDGAVLQLGYYSGSTPSTPFAGVFVPLTGSEGANSSFTNTSIGDVTANGAGPGTFALGFTFVQGSNTSGVSLPAPGTQMSIRFFNTASLSTATAFNAASDSLWRFPAPVLPQADLPVTYSFDDAGLVFQGPSSTGASGIYTSIPFAAVPEPSAVAALAIGGLGLAITTYRKRRSA